VLALCFTQTSESYHHWRVFSNGSSGICITFHRKELLAAARELKHIRMGAVEYLKLSEIGKRSLDARKLPFLKRYPFAHEEEFRLVYQSTKKINSIDIPIPLDCIDRITLSPWLNRTLSDDVKKLIWNIADCRELSIARSTLIGDDDWKSFGESATRHHKKR